MVERAEEEERKGDVIERALQEILVVMALFCISTGVMDTQSKHVINLELNKCTHK